MDAMEIQPQDALRAGDTSESTETRALDDATFEPGAHLEQTGDFRQAEAIQTNLETVMASITTETVGDLPIPLPHPEQGGESPQAILPEDSVAGLNPSIIDGVLEPPGGGEDDPDNIIPINLPGPQSTAGVEIGFTSMTKEPAGSVEIPLTGTAGEIGHKVGDGELQVPLASPTLEGVRLEEVKIDLIVARTQVIVDEMSEESNPEFLQLQQQMQLEDRTFTTVSNVIRTRHDTVKNSISNIR